MPNTPRAGLVWTPEETGKLLLMAEAGFTIRTAAEQLERTTKSVKFRYCDLKKIRRHDTIGIGPDVHLNSLDALAPGTSLRQAFERLIRHSFGDKA